ncbi:MAG: hypothetical protein KAT85_09115 [candidate division Zixibacteria bacterium]|nr:hypothetical protein [candidate division Zixibacteria bacterium]
MKKLSGDIRLAPSSSFAESVLFYGMMQGRNVTLGCEDALIVPDGAQDFAVKLGYRIDTSRNSISLLCNTEPGTNNHPIESRDGKDFFRKMLVLARAGFDVSLKLPVDTANDFETEFLLFRRMGFECELIGENDSRLRSLSMTPTRAIKYSLPKKNYHLIEPLIAGVMASGCSVELISPFEIDYSKWGAFPALGIEIKPVVKNAEENELTRRINRLRSVSKKEFKYTVRRTGLPEEIGLLLPGDHLLGLFAAGLVCMRRNSSVRLLNLASTHGVTSAFRMIAKMGAEVSIKDVKADHATPLCEVIVTSDKLTGKRFGGDSVRACPEASCVVAALGMIAEGKTVVRDLPFGSSIWCKRVGYVREILNSCGARVGEIEDGLVVEAGEDLMMMTYRDTGDELCELLQQMLSLALPHHSDYHPPSHFENSALFGLYNELTA